MVFRLADEEEDLVEEVVEEVETTVLDTSKLHDVFLFLKMIESLFIDIKNGVDYSDDDLYNLYWIFYELSNIGEVINSYGYDEESLLLEARKIIDDLVEKKGK